MENPEYFDCRCHSPEHTLRMWIDDEPGDACVYISVFLANDPWYRRLWTGVKYVFGYKCRYGHFDEFVLRAEDVDRFVFLLERVKDASKK